MRIHILIHAPFEEPGAIEDWAFKKNYQISSIHTYRGEQLPDIATIDFLIIMGGPQSPLELDKYPYLRDEIALTKQAIDQAKPVLGICLGAQIIGESLGAKTEQSPHKEVGVFRINLTQEGINDPILGKLPTAFDVMHWHNDMPGVSVGGVVLAYSEGCPRQIIRYNERTYGLQCHMEMTTELVKGMTEHCEGDLKPARYVQNTESMLSANFSAINNKMFIILDELAATIMQKTKVNVEE